MTAAGKSTGPGMDKRLAEAQREARNMRAERKRLEERIRELEQTLREAGEAGAEAGEAGAGAEGESPAHAQEPGRSAFIALQIQAARERQERILLLCQEQAAREKVRLPPDYTAGSGLRSEGRLPPEQHARLKRDRGSPKPASPEQEDLQGKEEGPQRKAPRKDRE